MGRLTSDYRVRDRNKLPTFSLLKTACCGLYFLGNRCIQTTKTGKRPEIKAIDHHICILHNT